MTLNELRALATATRDGYACWGGDFSFAPTLAECEFLYALVRMTQPRRVLEFGTGRGVTTRFISEALLENGNGAMVLTVEPNRAYWPDAEALLLNTPAALTQIGDFSPADELVDLAFIDSGYEYRAADIREWLTNGYDGLVVVHDADRRYAELELGIGVFVPSQAGIWIGRGR